MMSSGRPHLPLALGHANNFIATRSNPGYYEATRFYVVTLDAAKRSSNSSSVLMPREPSRSVELELHGPPRAGVTEAPLEHAVGSSHGSWCGSQSPSSAASRSDALDVATIPGSSPPPPRNTGRVVTENLCSAPGRFLRCRLPSTMHFTTKLRAQHLGVIRILSHR